MSRMIKKLVYSAIAVVAVSCTALVAIALDSDTARLADPELLQGIPGAIKTLAATPPTAAERQAENGPVRYTEQFIPGMEGDPPVRILILEPKDAAPGRPGILDIHGGGYVGGSPEQTAAAYLDALVRKFGITAVSVDYRLAPDTHYPGSLHDNYAALQWFHAHAREMGVDPKRIATMGVSAGGGHAAALGIFARDKGEVPILFQMLLCPMLDDRTGSTLDPGKPFGHIIWSREQNHDGWKALLGMEPGGDKVPAGAVPMRVADLSGLPPTYISVGTLDLFAIEDISFAQKLMAAGVPTELHVYPGGFHAYEFVVPNARVSKLAMKALEDAMAQAFGLDQAATK